MSANASIEFSDEEIEIVKLLATSREHTEFNMFRRMFIQERLDLPEETVRAACLRLHNFGYITHRDSEGDSFSIESTIFTLRYAIDNQPLPNHWKNLIDWWFSKRWSMLVTAFVVVLPLIAQWVEMTKTILDWVTPAD